MKKSSEKVDNKAVSARDLSLMATVRASVKLGNMVAQLDHELRNLRAAKALAQMKARGVDIDGAQSILRMLETGEEEAYLKEASSNNPPHDEIHTDMDAEAQQIW